MPVSSNQNVNADITQLKSLKALLLEPEREELSQLQQLQHAFARKVALQIADLKKGQKLTPQQLAAELPEAVLHAARHDDALSDALSPTIEASLKVAIKNDPQGLVNAIFPILGPAIRKAISSTLQELVNSFNQVIEQSISAKGLRWRFESMRTGKPFAEIALLHSLIYSVEQVFFIHKDSGLLIKHEISANAPTQDPDMVSGMLSAIQSFVYDSFNTGQGDSLESLRVGDLAVWIESGPHAVVALVIRGNAPANLRLILQETVEDLHKHFSNPLEKFEGDTIPFSRSSTLLRKCLKTQFQQPQKKRPPIIAMIIISLAIISLIAWLSIQWYDELRWSKAVDSLAQTPGYVILSHQVDGTYQVEGLRDPLAAPPEPILAQHLIDPEKIDMTWRNFQSFDKEFIIQRIQHTLQPAANVIITMDDQSRVVFSGEAPHQWINRLQQTPPILFGVQGFELSDLASQERTELLLLIEKIDQFTVPFELGSHSLSPDRNTHIKLVSDLINRALDISKITGLALDFTIIGYADSQGGQELNQKLSLDRAHTLYQQLKETSQLESATLKGMVKDANSESTINRKAELHVNLKSVPQ